MRKRVQFDDLGGSYDPDPVTPPLQAESPCDGPDTFAKFETPSSKRRRRSRRTAVLKSHAASSEIISLLKKKKEEHISSDPPFEAPAIETHVAGCRLDFMDQKLDMILSAIASHFGLSVAWSPEGLVYPDLSQSIDSLDEPKSTPLRAEAAEFSPTQPDRVQAPHQEVHTDTVPSSTPLDETHGLAVRICCLAVRGPVPVEDLICPLLWNFGVALNLIDGIDIEVESILDRLEIESGSHVFDLCDPQSCFDYVTELFHDDVGKHSDVDAVSEYVDSDAASVAPDCPIDVVPDSLSTAGSTNGLADIACNICKAMSGQEHEFDEVWTPLEQFALVFNTAMGTKVDIYLVIKRLSIYLEHFKEGFADPEIACRLVNKAFVEEAKKGVDMEFDG